MTKNHHRTRARRGAGCAATLGQVCALSFWGCEAEPAASLNDSQTTDATTSTTIGSSSGVNPTASAVNPSSPGATPPVNPPGVSPSVGSPTATGPFATDPTPTGPTSATGDASGPEVSSDGATSGASAPGPGASSSEAADTGALPSSERAVEVCRRWNTDRADLSEGTWSGDIDACEASDVSAPGRENALKVLNLYRFLADMPEVEMDPERNQKAQECALMQSANGLSHEPPTSWKCYTEVGAIASGVSSISGGRGVESIDLYMTDGEFNADTMGHRRWVFANSLGPVGFGSAKSSCFHQADGTSNARKPFVAWPPPGPVPLQAILTTKVDTAGWTIQSDGTNLEEATVSVDEGGAPLAVTQTTLPGGYGSRYALRIVPSNWTLSAGHSYHVTVSGTDIGYTIDVVDCN